MYSGKSGCILPKLLYWLLLVVFGQKWLYSGKNGCDRDTVVVFVRKWLYSGKSGCIPAKMIVFKQKWLYSGNVVVFGQRGGF